MNFMADCSNIDPEERVYMIFLSVKKALRYKQLNVKYVCDRQTLECLYVLVIIYVVGAKLKVEVEFIHQLLGL